MRLRYALVHVSRYALVVPITRFALRFTVYGFALYAQLTVYARLHTALVYAHLTRVAAADFTRTVTRYIRAVSSHTHARTHTHPRTHFADAHTRATHAHATPGCTLPFTGFGLPVTLRMIG